MPDSSPLDRAEVYTWAEVMRLKVSHFADDDPHLGYELVGWLWRSRPGVRRWTFTTNLEGRAYVVTAQFVPIYAGMRTGA